MSSLIPISTYSLALQPFNPVPALDEEFPVTVRLTMAALDLDAVDDKEEPSTLRVLKRSRALTDDEDYNSSDSDCDESDELDSETEGNFKEIVEKVVAKKEEREKSAKKGGDKNEEDDSDEDEIEEFVLCTLSPKVQFQQILDITISPSDEIHFVVTGSYPVHLSGNFVEHPADDDSDDYDSDESSEEFGEDAPEGDENDVINPDEDESMNTADLDEISDVEGKAEKLVEQDKKARDKKNKKRAAADVEESRTSKKAKEDKKKVQFTKELEQGPTLSKKDAKKEKSELNEEPKELMESKGKKFKTSTLLGGVVTEDRKTGSGAVAKSGNKVGIRYIGKLKNGKVFDKNTSGKPFVFNLGKGECIKGFDLGVAGMAVGGERRVIIPAKMGYGSQALPGIPPNSELTFDIKLVSRK